MLSPSPSPSPFAVPADPINCHLFVVERDAVLRSMLCDYLEKQGWSVSALGSAEELLGCVDRFRPDLVVLGADLPRMTGIEACRRLRGQGDEVPIILLTDNGDSAARVDGLQAGADDCFGKPVTARELAARTRSLLRRVEVAAPMDTFPEESPVVTCRIGEFTFVPQTRSVHGDGRVRALNDVEFGVMLELVQNAGEPVARERLLQRAGPRRPGVRLRSIDTAVMRLRRLLEPDPAEPRYLQTVRGRGYMFVPPVPLL